MRTFIINYLDMRNIGGIEAYIVALASFYVNHGDRVIWLCDKKPRIAQSFSNVMNDSRVEKISTKQRGYHWFSTKSMKFSKEDEIVILSFSPIDMAKAIYLKNKYKDYAIKSYYVVANTTGKIYYPERYFPLEKQKRVHERLAKIVQKWEQANCIMFCSKTQIAPLEKNYGLLIKRREEKVVKEVRGLPALNYDDLYARAKRETFTIVTIGRFDFPHKGYMLGLVRAFGRLWKKHNNIRLKIIGCGPYENILINEIDKLEKECRSKINLLGEIAPEHIYEKIKDCSLNVSVAGAVGSGAKVGVLSIPARNWCKGECEVYGFLPESLDMTTSSEPGELVDNYIEQVINFSEEEYIDYSVASYDAYKNSIEVDPYYFFNYNLFDDEFIDGNDVHYLKKLSYEIRREEYLRILKKKLHLG